MHTIVADVFAKESAKNQDAWSASLPSYVVSRFPK